VESSLEVRHEIDHRGVVAKDRMTAFVLAALLSGVDLSTTGEVVETPWPRWLGSWRRIGTIPLEVHPTPDDTYLSEPEFEEIVDLSNSVPRFDKSGETQSDIVFARLMHGLGAARPSLLDLAIAMESALLKGTRDELRFRFALYGALFVADSFAPEDAFSRLKKVYDARSALVHGGPMSADELHGAAAEAAEFARAIGRRILTQGWPDVDTMNRKALGVTMGPE
jgi:hypothetical protein